MRDTMRSIGRLLASYFSLQFFPLFFALFQRRSWFRADGDSGWRQEGKCARHVAAETFVIRDGASEGRVFAARRMPGVGSPFERANTRPSIVPDVSGVRGCGIRALFYSPPPRHHRLKYDGYT